MIKDCFQTMVAVAAKLMGSVCYGKRNKEKQGRIKVPRIGYATVQQRMQGSLGAAARAVVAADGAQDAARSVAGGVGRIEVTVEKNKCCHSTCYCKCGGSGFKMFFQLPVH